MQGLEARHGLEKLLGLDWNASGNQKKKDVWAVGYRNSAHYVGTQLNPVDKRSAGKGVRLVHERDRHGRSQGVPKAYVGSKDDGAHIDAVGGDDTKGNAGVPNTQRVKVESPIGKILA
jgi:hypothetical protein